jgi:hypothetical protein
MTSIRVRGINRVTAKGRVYYYHSATGKRMQCQALHAVGGRVERRAAGHQGAGPEAENVNGTRNCKTLR